MTTRGAPTFGDALSHYRLAAGLTQEELAERANLSVRGISDLERGVRTRPQPMTVRQLAEALQLSPQDRAVFEEAAHTSGAARRRDEALPEGSFLGALPSAPLVGREDDVERMGSILDAVVEGSGHVLLLSGELGVGKTRLLQELMVAARSRDFLVVTGRCDAAEQQRLYAPFLDALGGLTASMPSGARSEGQRLWKRVQQLTRAASDCADMVVHQHLFGAVAELLVLISRSVPLALLLDDLQWADGGSLKLLHHLARTTRSSSILLAGAFRDLRLSEEHPDLAHALQLLGRERLAERITVRRLSLEETTSLVAVTMDHQEVSEEFAHFVYRRTKGIPRLIDQLVRSLGGRLELHGEIGAGAMGRVFQAFDRATEQTVAAKLVLARQEIDLDTLLRFQQEGAVLAQLDHPHIVRIYDTFVEEHASCIIMELLAGQSLGAALQDGPLALSRAKQLALQVTDALGYAHSQGIVHRDIKPDNVMVLPDDQVKVTDFGIARILQPDTSLQTIATTGMRMGTPLYMAPEQIEGKRVDGRTDVYALGAMLYHMVTGKPPFEGTDALTVAVKHLQEEPRAPSAVNPQLPAKWDALILRALAKDPKARFQSAGEMAQALQRLPAQPEMGEEAHVARRRRRSALAGTLSALAVGMVAILAIVFRLHPAAGHTQVALAGTLNAYLDSLASRHEISGTVLVARNGQTILSRGFGLADRQHQVPNLPMTKYQGFGFNTNIVAALRLEEEGKIHGSDRICEYLPDCPANWRPITFHQVLDGTSGLFAINWSGVEGTPAQSLQMCHGPLQPPPTGATDYENCDVVVLGTIIERVTREPWGTAMRRLVFDPAGMRHSGRLTDALHPPARGNDYTGSVPDDRLYFNSYFTLYAPAPDDLAYDEALFGGTLLSPRDLGTLLTPRDLQPDPGILDARQAYKWKVGRLAGQRVVYTLTNAGNAAGVNLWFPGDHTAVIVLSNVLQDDPEPVAVNLCKLLYGQKVVFPVLQAHVRSVPPSRAVLATIDAQTFADAPAFMNHAIWLPNDNIHTVTRVSDRSHAVAGITPLTSNLVGPPGSGDVSSVASDGSQLWVTYTAPFLGHRGVVARLNPVTGKVMERIPVPGGNLFQMAVSHGIVWGTSGALDDLIRVDPRTRHVTQVGHKFGGPIELAVGGGYVWVSSHREKTVGGTLRKIDARTGRVVATLHIGTDPESLALGFGSLWLVNGTGGYVSRIDPRTGKVVAQIAVGTDEENTFFSLHSVAVGYGAVWVAVHKDGKLVRIDPATNRVTSQVTLPIPQGAETIAVWDVAVGDGSVWVHAEPHLLYRIDPKAMA